MALKLSPRKCKECGSTKPGMHPLRIQLKNGSIIRGYWHLKCFDKAKKKEIK